MQTDYVGLAFAAGDGTVEQIAVRSAVAERVGPGARIRSRSGAVLALLETDGGLWSGPDTEALRRAVETDVDQTISMGVGGPRPREAGPYGVAFQAEQALTLGRALFGPGRVTRYDELGAYTFVLGRPTFELRRFCARVLGPLAEAEHRDLMLTLEEFLRSHGSLNEVARRMFLHRNTVRMRLRRIRELTGADLNDHDERLSLQLALLGRAALEHIGEGASAQRTHLADTR